MADDITAGALATKLIRMRYIVIISTVLGGFLLYLLSEASPETSESNAYYDLLVGLNIVFAGFLLLLISVQLFGLYVKVKQKVIGVKFTLRLLTSFALMALLPGLIVYLVSVNFMTKSIDSWFNVKVEAALEGGLSLGQNALDILLLGVQANAENMAEHLSLQPVTLQSGALNDLRLKSGIKEATILTQQGQIVSVSSDDSSSFLPSLPSATDLQEARNRIVARIDIIENKGLFLRVLAPVNSHQFSNQKRILQLLQPVPSSLGNTAESVQSVYQDYQKLSFNRATLRDVFALTLTLVMMFAMLVALAVAFVLSKKIASPLTVLSEGTKAIASGDYSTMLPEHSKDELGVLVKSFNSMTRQLNDATTAAELNRDRVEQARGYLETILAYLSSGVIALNASGELRTFNEAAIDILGVDLTKYTGFHLNDIILAQSHLANILNVVSKQFKEAQLKSEEQVQIELIGQKGKQFITLRGTHLPDGGYVAVFDDSTDMVQVQREAAWGEVARRLAHEIKNPLTPIQLSAERLSHKLTDKLEASDATILSRSIKTIVNQVDAMKKMVNEFSEYARAPAPKLAPLDLNLLVKEVTVLYEADAQSTAHPVQVDLCAGACMIKGDTTMLRQVIHNLLQNAQDASPSGQVKIKTMIDQTHAVLCVEDEGGGFPAEILPHAFEPYMTTKTHGTGLGLAVVKKIVDEHAGVIRVENITVNRVAASTQVIQVEENTAKHTGTNAGQSPIIGAMVTIHIPMMASD